MLTGAGVTLCAGALLATGVAAVAGTSRVAATTAPARLVRVVESQATLPAGVGLAFSPHTGSLFLTARPASPATNVARLTPLGKGVRTQRLALGLGDPINMTFDSRRRRLVLLPAGGAGEIAEIREGAGGTLRLQSLRRTEVRGFKVSAPVGMAVDPASGAIFVLDARGPAIVKLLPRSRRTLTDAAVSRINLAGRGLRKVRGLAYDLFTGHFHIRSGNRLVELSGRGGVVAVRDLSRLRLRDPQGFTFAATGDTTDDRARSNLYLTDAGPPGSKGSGQIVEISLEPPSDVGPISFRSQVVRAVNTSAISPRSPDPSGVAYVQSKRSLMIVDGEVEEAVGGVTHFAGANIWELTLAGKVVRTVNASRLAPAGLGRTDEPTDIAWNATSGHYYVSDDDKGLVWDVDPGPDATLGTADDAWSSFNTKPSGNTDPEGIAYDSKRNRIFVADGINQEVYEYTPDGEPVAHFDVSAFGLFDPEGIEYNADRGTLYILGDAGNPVIVETSTSGALLRTLDFSAAGAFKPAGLALAPASDGSGKQRFYVVDRGIDNNVDPDVVDGKLYELTAPGAIGGLSTPPKVDAGADQTVPRPGTATLQGHVSDDGAPKPPGAVTATWSQISGPGTVAFGNPRAPSTSATFSIAGVYRLRLSANDGEWTTVDDVTVTVEGAAGVSAQDVRVAGGADDAEESTTGAVTLTSTDLDLMIDSGSTVVSTNLVVGLRFRRVAIPRGATITNAFIQFQADEVSSETTRLTIRAQAHDNAPVFTEQRESLSSRETTAAEAKWAPAPWRKAREVTIDQRTPNLKAVIQEVVNRPGWTPGNAVVVLVRGAAGSHRVARAADTKAADGAAPMLHLEWR